MNTVWTVIFVLLLIDSLGANVVAWFEEKWYKKHFRTLSRVLPLTKGWTAMYLTLVIILGIALYQYGAFAGV
jgi:hypothetical protein